MSEQQEAFSRALKQTKDGNYAAALKEFIWLHDNPNPGDPSSEMFRRANGFLAWATLGNLYPPAIVKMREVLEAKLEWLENAPDDKFVGADASALEAALATYDSE
jgi:hypothetical protein